MNLFSKKSIKENISPASQLVTSLLNEEPTRLKFSRPLEDEECCQDEADSCPVCGGEGNFLGHLGDRCHFRCRQCGIDFNALSDAGEEAEETPPPKAMTLAGAIPAVEKPMGFPKPKACGIGYDTYATAAYK